MSRESVAVVALALASLAAFTAIDVRHLSRSPAVERWQGRVVSVVDPASGRRSKTTLWPGRSDDRAFSPALGWSIMLGNVWLVWSVRLIVCRVRS